MAYTVKITFKGVQADFERLGATICPTFVPTGSYIDSPVFTEGYKVGDDEGKKYGKSVYATNVDGWGNTEVKEPYASTSIPMPVALAQFKLSTVADDKDENQNPYVEFDVEDYKEAFYYKELGNQMADQGFEVVVSKK